MTFDEEYEGPPPGHRRRSRFSTGGWLVGLAILVAFLFAMQGCQGDDACDAPTSEYQIEQCEMERP